jgi:hypothetical protein
MRVAYLANPACDYLQDLVYHGLATVLGPENVSEFPPLDRYHCPPPVGETYPQLWFGFPEPPRLSFRETVLSSDAVVIGSLRSGVRALVDELLTFDQRPPIVYLDGEDHFFVLGIRTQVEIYFKRELVLPGAASRVGEGARKLHRLIRKRKEVRDPLADHVGVAWAGNDRLRPLPFAWVGPVPEPRVCEFDVAFLSSPSNPVRDIIRSQLERLSADGVRVRMLEDGERLDWWSYMDVLASSRIGISVRGGGYDTFRYWEIPAARALLLAETPRTVIPGNFIDRFEAIYAPIDKLVSQIPHLLDGTDAIALAGHRRLRESHMSVHRAQTIVDAVARLL